MKKSLLSLAASVLTVLPLLGVLAPGLTPQATAATNPSPRWIRYGFYQNYDTANEVSQSLINQGYRTLITSASGGYILYYWQ